jgi:hypothetical protein
MMKKGGDFTFRLVLASSLHVRLGVQTKNPGSSKAVDEHFYRPTDRTSLATSLATSTNLRRKS